MTQRRKRLKKKRFRPTAFFWALLVFIVLVVVFLLLFRTRDLQIVGARHTPYEQIHAWFDATPRSSNSLYAWYHFRGQPEQMPANFYRVDARLQSPWSILLTVQEWPILGYVEVFGVNAFFDVRGTVVLMQAESIEGVPLLEGLQFEFGEVELFEQLPVRSETLFMRFAELRDLLTQHQLEATGFYTDELGITVYFNDVAVRVGLSNYPERVAQIAPILERLYEYYPHQAGVLHLDSFDRSSTGIRFSPARGGVVEYESDSLLELAEGMSYDDPGDAAYSEYGTTEDEN